MVDIDIVKDVMARFPTGVAIVTTSTDGGYHGVTVSSFSSLSLEPPLILFALEQSLQSHERIAQASHFVVNLLSSQQSFLAEQFSGRTPLADPEFSRVSHTTSRHGIPKIQGCTGWVECSSWATYPGGDHTIFVGQVIDAELGSQDDPLVYFDRGFTLLEWS